MAKIYRVMANKDEYIQMKLNQSNKNVHMITDLPKKAYLSAITVTDISQSFTYNMAAKINWHR